MATTSHAHHRSTAGGPAGAVLLSLFLILTGGIFANASATITAEEILDRVDDIYRGDSARGKMAMKIVTAHWTRSLEMEFWSEGEEKSLIRILAPKKERGTATLRSDRDMWNYLPKVNRVIKIPSSMMSASWMGSHFTNDDLVKESRMTKDFDFEATFEGERDGVEIVEITCVPKENAAIVWGKVICVVRSEDVMPLAFEYYDEEMNLARTLEFSDFRVMGGRLLPAVMEVVPVDKPEESTVVTYHEIEFDVEMDRDLFSLRSLQR